MRRTNIYLSDPQLATLRRIGERRGRPMAELVREAVDQWLTRQGVRVLEPDEWTARFDDLLARRRRVARQLKFDEATVERDVTTTIADVRRRGTRAARRR